MTLIFYFFLFLTLCESWISKSWVPLLYVIGNLGTPKPTLLIHLYFVSLLTYISHTFTMNYGKALSDPCWFRALKLAFYFSTVGCRVSTSPHPVSCAGWKLWAARPSTPTSMKQCRAPASFGPLESSPGSFCRPMTGSTSIKPPTSPDLLPPGEICSEYNVDYLCF